MAMISIPLALRRAAAQFRQKPLLGKAQSPISFNALEILHGRHLKGRPHDVAPPRRNTSSFAMFAAIRRASSAKTVCAY
jgi:hypothetical protein